MPSDAEIYARKVLSGEIVTGKYIKDSAKRFLSDLERDDIYFDEVEANKIVNFVEKYCCHWEDKWRGTKIVLELWQKFIFMQIFGWIVKESGLRRTREVFVEIAKKNSKTTMGALIALFHLYVDKINSPKVFVGANNEEQAKICVNTCGRIVEQSPDLYEFVEDGTVKLSTYMENIVRVIHDERDGFIKPMPKEPSTTDTKQSGGKHGINPSLVVIDEYAMADSDTLINTMESAMGARQEAMLFCITTAGYKQNGPCFTKLRKRGIDVNSGVLEDDSFLAFIWEPDEGDKIDDMETWPKSNPNMNVSVFKEFLKSRLIKARSEGGTKLVDVQTYNFNMWVDSPEVWIQKEVWEKNVHGISEIQLQNTYCFAGLEIISGLSLNALAFYFPEFCAVKVVFWMPHDKVRENDLKIDFSKWVDKKHIITTPGNVIDNEVIFDMIQQEISKYNVNSLAFSKVRENDDILQGLVKLGVECNPLSQGYQGISTPTKTWEEMITAGKIEHFNNPVLTWMNGNCMILRKGDEIMLQKAGGRIAGISACIYALAQSMSVEIYDDTQFFSL